jgi:hypothetical protein
LDGACALAFWLIQAIRPRVIVELGTHFGFSYLAFCQAVQQSGLATRCYAVDTWKGDEHAGFYGEEVFASLSATNDENYSAFSRLLRVRFDDALPHFADGEIDLLHVDGRHRYEDVLEDYGSWRPKLSDRAVVLFHDTNVREGDFGVWKFWQEIEGSLPSFSFVHGHGLGVLAIGPDVPPGLRPLLGSSPQEVAGVRAAYARLAARWRCGPGSRRWRRRCASMPRRSTGWLRIDRSKSSTRSSSSGPADRSQHAQQLERALQDRSQHAQQLERALQDRSQHAQQLERALQDRSQHAQQLERELGQAEGELAESMAMMERVRNEVDVRSRARSRT